MLYTGLRFETLALLTMPKDSPLFSLISGPMMGANIVPKNLRHQRGKKLINLEQLEELKAEDEFSIFVSLERKIKKKMI